MKERTGTAPAALRLETLNADAVLAFRRHPGLRRSTLRYRFFWKESHARLALAVAGLAASLLPALRGSRPDLAPEAAGLLAVSLGLSRMHSDDLAQLEAGLTLYDAFYRWCRDATDETPTRGIWRHYRSLMEAT